eukprot:1143635-Pelagomonas_calceolata.AAC.10
MKTCNILADTWASNAVKEVNEDKDGKYCRGPWHALRKSPLTCTGLECIVHIMQEEIDTMDRLKVLMLSNLALCCTVLGDYPSAAMYASKGLELDEENPKLLFRCVATQ